MVVGRGLLKATSALPLVLAALAGSLAATPAGANCVTAGSVTDCGTTAPNPDDLNYVRWDRAYSDTAAAHAQHERNVADERVGSSSSVDPALGTASATLLHRDAENLLLTASDAVTLDLDLPPRPAPLPPTDLLLDLARRVLARLAPSGSDAGAPL